MPSIPNAASAAAGPARTPGQAAAGACLRVKLARLQENYRTVAAATRGEAAAVVKADGYGLGLEAVARALHQAGCRTFFTAFAAEGVRLRGVLDQAAIYVLSPLVGLDHESLAAHRLTPCLYSPAEVDEWVARAPGHPAALHVETGINRLGMDLEETRALLADRRRGLDVALLMSHLACADEPGSPVNPRQLDRFRRFRELLPGTPASLCNSAGIFLGPEYHFDLVRPGICLYGHDPHYRHRPPRVRSVATLEAHLAQVKTVPAGGTVGYGAFRVGQPTQVGVVLAGYGDGVPRLLFDPEHPDASAYRVSVAGHRCRLLGRISMDMTLVDVTGLPPEALEPGTPVEFFGDTVPIETLAEAAATIPYEILTGVRPRVPRRYE